MIQKMNGSRRFIRHCCWHGPVRNQVGYGLINSFVPAFNGLHAIIFLHKGLNNPATELPGILYGFSTCLHPGFLRKAVLKCRKKSHLENRLTFVTNIATQAPNIVLICGKNYILFGMKFKRYNRLICYLTIEIAVKTTCPGQSGD